MHTKFSRRTFLKASAGAGAVGLVGTRRAFSAARVTGKVAHTYGEGHPITIAGQQFAARLKERSKGDIDLTLFPGSQLGDEVQIAEAMRLGSIDGAYLTSPVLTGYIPELQVLDLPFMLTGNTHALAVATSTVEKLGAGFPDQGFSLAALIPSGGRNPFGGFPVETPKDVAGKKIRVIQAPLPVSLWTALGANPTPLPAPDIYSALQTKLVDLAENTKLNYEAWRFYEAAPYFSELNHQYAFTVQFFSQDFWQKLTPQDQELVKAVASELTPEIAKMVFDNEDGALARTVSQGVKASVVTDKQPWQDLARPIWADYSGKVPAIEPLIAMIEAVR